MIFLRIFSGALAAVGLIGMALDGDTPADGIRNSIQGACLILASINLQLIVVISQLGGIE